MFADEDLDAEDLLVLLPEDLDEMGIDDPGVRDRLLQTLADATEAHRSPARRRRLESEGELDL